MHVCIHAILYDAGERTEQVFEISLSLRFLPVGKP